MTHTPEVAEENKAEQAKLPTNIGELYVQLFNQCNKDPIAKLLDIAKDHSKEANKAILKPSGKVDRLVQLKKAVDANYLDSRLVYELLRDSEETGQQHIFLYKPRSAKDAVVLKDGAEVSTRLFDEAWGPDYFPLFTQPEKSLAFVDFRLGVPGHPRDWVVKAYGHGVKLRTVDRSVKNIDAHTFTETRTVTREDVRTVMVARWRDPHFLEVRIDRTKSSGEEDMASRLRAFMDMLAPAFTTAQLTAHQLRDTGEQLILERKLKDGKQNPAYTLNSLTLLDKSEGEVLFRPKEPQQGIDDDDVRVRALEAALGGGAQAIGLSITWQPCDSAPTALDSPVTTIITGAAYNELVFSARLLPTVFDYVIGRLVQY